MWLVEFGIERLERSFCKNEEVSESHDYKWSSSGFVKVPPLRRTLCNNACADLFIILKQCQVKGIKWFNDRCGTAKPLLWNVHFFLVSQCWIVILCKPCTKQFGRKSVTWKVKNAVVKFTFGITLLISPRWKSFTLQLTQWEHISGILASVKMDFAYW